MNKSISYENFLRKIPKAELHVHFAGTMRESTLQDIANKNEIPSPIGSQNGLYSYTNLPDFLKVFDYCSRVLQTGDDFSRVAYETLEDGFKGGNLRYREMFYNPTTHIAAGVRYETAIDGILDGIRAAERDFGVRCAIIPAIYRAHSPAMTQQAMEALVATHRDHIIGMGSDALPADGTEGLHLFVDTYRYAKGQGLYLTAHAAEGRNSHENFTFAMDVLGCDRIDHGYDVLADDALVKRAVDEQISFTCCPTAAAVCLDWPDRANQPIREMIDRGMNVTLNSDDPAMFGITIGDEFVTTCLAMEIPEEKAVDLALAGVRNAWVDDADRKTMMAEFKKEIASMRGAAQLA